MRLSLPLGAVFLAVSIVAAAAQPCGPKKRVDCVLPNPGVDFSAVSDISKKIVAEEPPPPKAPAKPVADGPGAPVPYTGPTIGAAPLPRAPTVGFKWSLE
jgi:hypothetical protein